MAEPADDDALLAEIRRHARRRMLGAGLAFGFAALFAIPLPMTLRMMHGDHAFVPVTATIVEVHRDPGDGLLYMTSEFSDAAGVRHRATESEGYHYAPGDPRVGQHVDYLYETGPRTGDFHAFPRADRLLQWVFGVPVAIFGLLGFGVVALALRQRRFRRALVRGGVRETGQSPRIRRRTMVLPAGNRAQAITTWRLQASRFDAQRGGFVECHGDWEGGPVPELDPAATPVILSDPADPRRYWLPTGSLAPPA